LEESEEGIEMEAGNFFERRVEENRGVASIARVSAPRINFMRTIVVIPAFNEARTIREVVRGCLSYIEDVIVVDDGSDDATRAIAREAGAYVYTHLTNRGYGAALKTGIIAAQLRGADYVVTIDADGQHEPSEIASLIAPLQDFNADIVIGDRFHERSRRRGMSFFRAILIVLGNVFTWLLYGVWIHDTQSGFRAYSRTAVITLFGDYTSAFICDKAKRDDLRISALQAEGMEFSSEIIGEASRQGLRIALVPITVHYTDYSLAKGQNFSTGIKTALKLLLRRILR